MPARVMTYQDVEAAKRKQAMAEALMQRTQKLNIPTQAGSQYTPFAAIADALSGALGQYGAAKANKAYDTTLAGADEAQRGQNNATIQALTGGRQQIEGLDQEGVPEELRQASAMQSSMSDGSQPTPAGVRLQGAMSGMDPRQAQAALAEEMMKREFPQQVSPSVKYQVDAQERMAANRVPAQGSVSELEFYMGLSPEERKAAVEYARAKRPDQGPNAVTPVTIDNPTSPTGSAIIDARTGKPIGNAPAPKPTSKLSASGSAQARSKLADTTVLKGQIENLKKYRALMNTQTDTGYVLGGRQKYTLGAEQYDKALDAVRTTIRKLTRTPGEGSMSDWEGKLAQLQLPSRTVFNVETLDQGIEQLEQLVNGYHGVTSEMLGGIPEAPAAAGSPADPIAAAKAELERRRGRK